jgi:hypothetical protein
MERVFLQAVPVFYLLKICPEPVLKSGLYPCPERYGNILYLIKLQNICRKKVKQT